MFDLKVLIVMLILAAILFGTKRLRSMGSDLGDAVKSFKQAMHDAETSTAEPSPKSSKDD
jgi:sec-independent protein translocase protein TatA